MAAGKIDSIFFDNTMRNPSLDGATIEKLLVWLLKSYWSSYH